MATVVRLSSDLSLAVHVGSVFLQGEQTVFVTLLSEWETRRYPNRAAAGTWSVVKSDVTIRTKYSIRQFPKEILNHVHNLSQWHSKLIFPHRPVWGLSPWLWHAIHVQAMAREKPVLSMWILNVCWSDCEDFLQKAYNVRKKLLDAISSFSTIALVCLATSLNAAKHAAWNLPSLRYVLVKENELKPAGLTEKICESRLTKSNHNKRTTHIYIGPHIRKHMSLDQSVCGSASQMPSFCPLQQTVVWDKKGPWTHWSWDTNLWLVIRWCWVFPVLQPYYPDSDPGPFVCQFVSFVKVKSFSVSLLSFDIGGSYEQENYSMTSWYDLQARKRMIRLRRCFTKDEKNWNMKENLSIEHISFTLCLNTIHFKFSRRWRNSIFFWTLKGRSPMLW